MAWTAPKTWTVAEVLTAANMNTHVRDNLAFAAGSDHPSAMLWHSVVQGSGTSGVQSEVFFDTEVWDVGALRNPATFPNRIVVPVGGAGKWLVGATVEYAAAAIGYRTTVVMKNSGNEIASSNDGVTSINVVSIVGCFTHTDAVVGDFFTCRQFQDSSAPINIGGSGGRSPRLWATWESA